MTTASGTVKAVTIMKMAMIITVFVVIITRRKWTLRTATGDMTLHRIYTIIVSNATAPGYVDSGLGGLLLMIMMLIY
jgi:hypothetical protein